MQTSSSTATWRQTNIGSVCRLINGRAYKKSELLDAGKYRVLRVGNFFTSDHWYFSNLELEPDKYCSSGDLLYAWSASFGPRFWAGEKSIFHYHIWKVDPDPAKVTKEFLFYFFEWDKDKIRDEQGAGATMVHVSKTSMEARRISLPSLSEQKRIVAILDQAFAALDRARAHAEANLADIDELLEISKTQLLQQAGKLGRSVSFSEVVSIESSLVDPKLPENIDLPHLGAGNMVTNSDALLNVQTAREEKLKSGKHTFEPGMVLYSKIRPYLKKVARPDFRGLCSADVYPLSTSSELDRDFLFHMLLGRDFTDYAISGSDRAGMPKVNRAHLFRYRFSLPPLEVQKEVARNIDAVMATTTKVASHYQAKLADLAQLRQSLLQQAFSGKLT